MKLRKLTTITYTIGEIRNFINSHIKNIFYAILKVKKIISFIYKNHTIIMFVNTLVFISSSIKVGCQFIMNLNKIYAMKIKL